MNQVPQKNYIEKTADLIEYFSQNKIDQRNIREKKDLIKDIAETAKKTPVYLSTKNAVEDYVKTIEDTYNDKGDAAVNSVVNFMRVISSNRNPKLAVPFIIFHLPAIDHFASKLPPVISLLKKV